MQRTSALQWIRSAAAPPFVIGALSVTVFLIWAARDAGYQPTTWYPGALFFLGLAGIAALVYRVTRPSPWILAAVGIFAAFAAWSAASILWSADRGIAWEGANRTVLYLLVFGVFALLPWPRKSIPLLLCAFSLGVLAIGLVDLMRATWGGTDPFFIHGRFSASAGYANAACALYLMSVWPLAYVAARREPPPIVRAVLIAAATALAELGVLAESRGSLFAVPIVVVAYLLIVPRRLRAAATLLVLGIAVFLSRGVLVGVYDSVRNGQDPRGHLQHALVTIAVSAAGVFLVWAIVSVIDRRVEFDSRFLRTANASAVVAAVLIVLAGGIAFATADPGPTQRIGDAWRQFKAGYQPTSSGGSHFSSGLGNNRYDFWRVVLIEFRNHPVNGVGVDNFAEDYVRLRHSDEEPLYPHSLELRVLAQTGVVGALLFGALMAVVAVGIFFATRRGDLAAGAARAGVVGSVYWAVHGSADWFWEFPALTAPALAWLGLALASSASLKKSPAAIRRLHVGYGSLLVAVVAISFALPWLAELNTRQATSSWGRDRAGAFADLRRARNLNPLSAQPDLLAGAIASRLNDLREMQRSFKRAIQRDPDNWYSHFELALSDAGLNQRARALEELVRAAKLNPGEPVVKIVRHDLEAGRRIDRTKIDQLFKERVRARVGP